MTIYPAHTGYSRKVPRGETSVRAPLPNCFRWAEIDLQAMVDRGEGDRRFEYMLPRCRACGDPGKWQARPPTGAT